MLPLTRREFVRKTTLAAAATQLVSSLRSAETAAIEPSDEANLELDALRWVEGGMPSLMPGTTWGRSWARGQQGRATAFTLKNRQGETVPLQSWPLAYWPDGSLKWTAHALPASAKISPAYHIEPGAPSMPATPVRVVESADSVEIETGVIRTVIGRTGTSVIRFIMRNGREIAREGKLVCQCKDHADPTVARTELFTGEIAAVTVEQSGPVRAVVRIEGKHRSAAGRAWLPFVVRLYFYAGGEMVRLMHTIIFDGKAQTDYISGLGVTFAVPMRGPLYDRHVRFSGQESGLFAEAVRGLTGLRRDPGAAVRAAQLAGKATPPLADWNQQVATRLDYIAAYSDWTLVQPNCDGFEIRKRTHEGCTWLSSARGQRAGGLGYVGTPSGGVAFGLRNFWQSYPAQLDIRGATGDEAKVTAWLWAPEAAAMDLRPYHDGLGMDTYEKQYNGGLEITYEDYEPGYNSPEGVARTSELHLWCVAATPERSDLVAMQQVLQAPPLLASSPVYLQQCGVFGGLWSPVDRSTPARAEIEDRLAAYFDYYQGQREEHRWYGFWNYGDVMHTYDVDRHEWRYDVGGFAWDNSELSTDLWLWMYYLKSGRADVFRFAEAMTRHTGEVDVHHSGRFAPLGSRHNVQHWGCSAKQLRISTALNRRYYYYLTGDERVGDLMREQVEAGHALLRVPPGRKLASAVTAGDQARGATENETKVGVSFGTDWGSMAGAWLTEWERTGDPRMLGRLSESMRTIGEQPNGFFSNSATINLLTGAFTIPKNAGVSVSHLNAVFGLVEVCAELNQLIDDPGFRHAWLEYCVYYNASAEEQRQRFGAPFKGAGLQQGHSRLTAYAAKLNADPALAQRAWSEFFKGAGGQGSSGKFATERIVGPAVLRAGDEAAFVSTNSTAQWGLAAIECLALIGDSLERH